MSLQMSVFWLIAERVSTLSFLIIIFISLGCGVRLLCSSLLSGMNSGEFIRIVP